MTDDDIALAHRLADAAGEAIRPYFRSPHGLEMKADATPVTLADRAAEAATRTILEAERPHDGIIGEEYGSTREGAERVWVLDPIDGTKSFIAGRAIFGTLIALMERGAPVLGVIDQPVQRERWIGARGRATTFNGVEAATRKGRALNAVHLATSGPLYFTGADFTRFERVQTAVATTSWGGDCYNYGLVASGHLDLVVEAGLKLHDWAALAPVVEGAGGRMTDWSGAPLTMESDGRVIAMGDGALLPRLIALLA